MTLSSLAVKALIGFSLGLSANTLQNQTLNDTARVKKTNCEIKPNKKKLSKAKQNSLKEVRSTNRKTAEEPHSCGKCGKG